MPDLAIREASDPAELEEIAIRLGRDARLQRQKEQFQAWHAWNQEYQKSGFGDDCYWTIGSDDPIPCDQELEDSAAALTVEIPVDQALEINQDNQVPNLAYFQALRNRCQTTLL